MQWPGPVAVLGALAAGVAIAAMAAIVIRPTRRLAPRLRPYTLVSRTALGRSPDVLAVARPSMVLGGSTLRRLFGPILLAIGERFGSFLDGSSEEAMRLKIRQSGLYTDIAEADQLAEYRLRQLGSGAVGALAGMAVGIILDRGAVFMISMVFLGGFILAARARGSLDRAIEDRQQRMRIEIYTVNQLLAMRVRVGGGVVQAVQQMVLRGNGAVIDELREALRLIRNGLPASESFDRIARNTPEPHCARTYSLLAAAEERGADLGQALLALSEDVREARREAMKRTATKRRAAMLVPTIAILAPVLLLFVAAPLPDIVFGGLR